MDRLASCYFCGEAFDASLSEYPVVPTELRSAGDGPTVVLCGTCRQKLGAVVEEVVGAAKGEAATTDAGTAGRRDDPTETTATNSDESADAADGSLLDDGADDAATADTDESTATSAEEWDSPTSDDGRAETNGEPDSDGANESEPTLTKLEYNKVMRLLQNRQFPVDRGEIREVATSAYDIDSGEFDAVIEAAIERDLVAVEGGQFVDPA